MTKMAQRPFFKNLAEERILRSAAKRILDNIEKGQFTEVCRHLAEIGPYGLPMIIRLTEGITTRQKSRLYTQLMFVPGLLATGREYKDALTAIADLAPATVK